MMEDEAKPAGVATSDHYYRVIDDSAEVRAHDGRLVLKFIKRALPRDVVERARKSYSDLDEVERPSLSRRAAAGLIDPEAFKIIRDDVVGVEKVSPTSGHLKLKDGRTLKQVMSNPVHSYLAGFTVSRFGNRAQPARVTSRYPECWDYALPFFQAIDRVHAMALPDVHELHEARCRLHPKWTIPHTALSTVTINVNYESRYHRDTGDFKDGFSTLTVVEIGRYTGGLLVFPKHRVAVDVRERDVLLCQSHIEMHGNTALEKLTPDAKRISFVTYLKHGLAGTENAMEGS